MHKPPQTTETGWKQDMKWKDLTFSAVLLVISCWRRWYVSPCRRLLVVQEWWLTCLSWHVLNMLWFVDHLRFTDYTARYSGDFVMIITMLCNVVLFDNLIRLEGPNGYVARVVVWIRRGLVLNCLYLHYLQYRKSTLQGRWTGRV